MTCSVVCVSHASGSGGEEVGRLVADRLGFSCVDEEIVAAAAARGGVGPGEVADEERRRSLAQRILDAMAQTGAEAWAASAAVPVQRSDYPSGIDLRALIRGAIEETAGRGRVVIVAHAAAHALGARPGLLRVLVTASPRTRAGRVGAALGLDEGRAVQAVKSSDAARRDYLKRFYDVSEESPTQYDLVVNTDVLTVEDAARLVAQAAS